MSKVNMKKEKESAAVKGEQRNWLINIILLFEQWGTRNSDAAF